jgi:fatty acid desaturase
MRFFRYREDKPYVFLFLCLFAIDVSVYFLVDSIPLLFLWTLAGIFPKSAVCAHNHHHQHVPVFLQPVLNRLLEIVYGLQTGAMTNAWVLHHSVGHHVTYLDQKKDESRWMREDGSKMGELEYAFDVTVTAYPRAWHVGARYPKHRRTFLVMGIITLSIVALAVWYRPWAGVAVFVIPPIISLFGTAWATYSHHSGRPTTSHFVACTNIMHPAYNVWTGNLGYHTAHHFRSGVHWSRLPALHKEIEHLIPADCYVDPGFPWKLTGQRVVPPPPGAKTAPTTAELLTLEAFGEHLADPGALDAAA